MSGGARLKWMGIERGEGGFHGCAREAKVSTSERAKVYTPGLYTKKF